ncbi:type III secretion system translocator chaperone SicA [Pantoea sp. SORGH_AS_0659]|uniref:type III secretion system translocator chaperone SicA n=1 Tax=Pantoea sp. SORGH_AS_0659 TaxID=3062597 RepID=UPI00285ED5E0|nr:type III secretion system translocator chaperone SicA [Pantoea sp. SORGH_AS_0659]MDR6352529.1 type III secretion system low calcium response chaperone LcrH/SycD [Pantoea sp. SORGH_AS_0659]
MLFNDENAHDDKMAQLVSMLMDYIQEGVTLREIENVADETMEEVYAHAYHFYQQGKLDEAEELFKSLCMFDLNNSDYYTGLGAVHQLKKNYQKACDLYSVAYVLGKEDYRPVFYSGQCNLLMGFIGKALQCFELVIHNCSDEKLRNKAKIYLETIKANKNKGREDKNTPAATPE